MGRPGSGHGADSTSGLESRVEGHPAVHIGGRAVDVVTVVARKPDDGAADVAVLDEGSFTKATTDLAFLAKSGKKSKKVGSVALRPYAVTRIAATK